MTILEAIIIAIVEGLTEFLPISSTAHMRITEAILGLSETDEFTKLYTVVIQFGAILSVVFLYYKKFFNFKRLDFYVKIAAAAVPALIFGFLFNDMIDTVLEKLWIIGLILFLGGFLLLFADKLFTKPNMIESEEDISLVQSIKIGVFQCLAILFPGFSRSAASIIGGMSIGVSRSAAAEFSFFLAVPTMFAATLYKTYKFFKAPTGIQSNEIMLLILGNVVAFIVALLAIKFFIGVLKKYGFRAWGFYRIILGAAVLIWALVTKTT